MRHPGKSVSLLVAILAAVMLTAGCGSSVSSAINHLKSVTATPTSAASPTDPVSPTTPASPTSPASPTAPASPTVITAPPSTATVTATATATPSASATPATNSNSRRLWLWIALAAAILVLLIILIAWISHSSRRRTAATASWQSRLIDVYAKGSALHDAMGVAETPGSLAAADAGARWADIQRRADDLTQNLYALREAASDSDEQARITDVLAALQAVRSAMDAERAPGGAGPQQAEVVRGRLYGFEMSLRALRAPDQRYN
jgi:hypothetical protein